MILRGDNFLPVKFAGQDEVQRPHSVHVYASIKFFQLKSITSFAPNLSGAAAPAGGSQPGRSGPLRAAGEPALGPPAPADQLEQPR